MNGHRLRVWVGRDGIMYISCFSVSIVVSGFSYAAQSCPHTRHNKAKFIR